MVVGLIGMGVSDTASALPEVFVGSRLVQNGSPAEVQEQAVAPNEQQLLKKTNRTPPKKPRNLVQSDKGKQTVQNKKMVGAFALIAGVLGMRVGGSAMAMPEMQLATMALPIAQQPANTLDSDAAPEDEDVQDSAS